MWHSLKCWPASFDAIVAGRKRAELRKNDRAFTVGDIVQLVRWDPEKKRPTIGRAEVLITHIDRVAGPAVLFGLVSERLMVPLVCLSFVFLRAEYPYPTMEQSEWCRVGDVTDDATQVPDRP